MKRLFLSLFLILGIFSLSSCNKPSEPKEFISTPIVDVLTKCTNNSEVKIEGIVYGVISNGFYVADSADGKIFVTKGSTWIANVKSGDKVQIEGQFSLVNNYPQIKSVISTKVVSENNTLPVVKTSGSISSIASMLTQDKIGTYGSVVSLTSTVEKYAGDIYCLTDDEGNNILVYSNSNVTALSQKLNNRVTLNVIVHNFSTSENRWQVSFVEQANAIVDSPLTFEHIISKALEDIQKIVPTDIYGIISLPKAHTINSYITYSWAVDANDYFIINNDDTVTINLDSEDRLITLKLTISNGVESRTIDYPVTSKAIVEQTVSSLLNNVPRVDMSAVIVSGIVVGIARNQSLSIRSLVIQDPSTLETTTVDFANTGLFILNNSEELNSISLGDLICVNAQYRYSGRPTIMNVTSIEKRSSGNPYQHDVENAFVLNDKESYDHFGENYHLYLNTLVKIENPFMNFSTSSTPSDTNWVRLGHDEISGNLGYGTGSSKRFLAFLIAAQNESLGNDSWYKMFDIPFLAGPAKTFDGYFYAYALYVSDTYLAFLIPDWSCWRFSEQLIIERDLGFNIPADSEGETITLPTTHEYATGNISWTSSLPNVINVTNGIIAMVDELTEVVLTASYIYNGTKMTSDYKVIVRPSVELSINEVLTDGVDGQIVKIRGILVGHSSDGNNNNARDGIILMDNLTGQMLLINGMAYAHTGNKYGQYLDNDGNQLSIGDEVIIAAPYYKNAAAIGTGGAQTGRAHLQLNDKSMVLQKSTNNEINFNVNDAVVIDSHEALQAMADGLKYGTLIKFVGSVENPLFIGGSSNSFPLNIKIFYNKNAVSNDETKYNGVIFSLKTDTNVANFKDKWWEDTFDIYKPFIGPSTTNPSIPCVGELYVVISALTSTYIQMNIVNVESTTIRRLLTEEQFETYLFQNIPTAVEPGEITFSLPKTSKYVTGEITWSSNNPLINLESGIIGSVTNAQEVILSARCLFDGETIILNHTITILPPPQAEPLSVSQLLISGVNGSDVRVKGYFAGYQSDGNTTGLLRGIIFMDKNTSETVLVDGVETLGGTYGAYVDNLGTLLELKDELIITATYVIDASGRKSLLLSADKTIQVVTKNNSVTWKTENAIVISNHEELLAFANNPQYGVLIKFVGTLDNPFLFGGSSTTSSAINYKFYYNLNAVDNNGTKYNGQTFSFKKTNNDPNAGVNWWQDIFGLPEAFVGPTATYPSIQKTGVIYAVLNSRTSTYFQLSIVNISGCLVNNVQ